MNQPADTEKPPRSKGNKMLSFLSKNVKGVSFQNLPFSPKRCHGHGGGKAFSGPIISMIPAKSKSGRRFDVDQEPTSPKISCMGQIKHKKKSKTVAPRPPNNSSVEEEKKKKKKKLRKPQTTTSEVGGMFSSSKPARNSDASDHSTAPVPGLGQMKKFASSRDSNKLAEFDWKDYSSDEDEVLVPHSAPIMIGGGRGGMGLEPRSEINLWKRRTMDPPKPLQLNSIRTSK